MASVRDERGYNQGFRLSRALEIRTERRCDYILNKINARKTARILEIGCGTGEMSYLLAKKSGAEVLGIDLSRRFIGRARKKYKLKNLRFEIADFNNPIGLGDRKFDYIVGNGILHHLYPCLNKSLGEMRRLLKPNGKIVFLEPNFWNPYCFFIFNFGVFRKMARLEPGEQALTKGFITRRLKKAGFSGIEVEYKDFLLPNTPKILINPSIKVGEVAERLPVLRMSAQSLFISARR